MASKARRQPTCRFCTGTDPFFCARCAKSFDAFMSKYTPTVVNAAAWAASRQRFFERRRGRDQLAFEQVSRTTRRFHDIASKRALLEWGYETLTQEQFDELHVLLENW